MRYHSDNKTVERELNKIWTRVLIPSLLIFIINILIGFHFIFKYHLREFYAPLSIFGSIIPSSIFGYQLSKLWFSNGLKNVDDPSELTERVIRYQILFESSTKKILKKNNITPIDRRINSGSSESKRIDKNVLLTKDYIEVNNEITFWKDIKNFRIDTTSYHGLNNEHRLYLVLKNDEVKLYNLSLSDIFKAEYEIDKYLNSKKI